MEPAGGRRPWREELRIELSSRFASAANRLFNLTYRLRRLQPPYAARRRAGESARCIYSVWHESLWNGIESLKHEDVCVMVSAHRDGEIIARVVARMGFELVRGSSTRGGVRAMRELVRFARERHGDLAVIVDGPKGPAREIKEGVLFAASRTGLPIVPLGLHVDRAWRARGWDQHIIGKPFARVSVTFGPELHVPPEATREELMGVWRARLAEAMDRAQAEARADAHGEPRGDPPARS